MSYCAKKKGLTKVTFEGKLKAFMCGSFDIGNELVILTVILGSDSAALSYLAASTAFA